MILNMTNNLTACQLAIHPKGSEFALVDERPADSFGVIGIFDSGEAAAKYAEARGGILSPAIAKPATAIPEAK
jgi:hypothetical protein